MVVEKHRSACALNCPDICAYIVHIEDDRITRIEGDPDHPYTLGRCCPKGYAHVQRMYYDDRLLYPQKRQPDGTFSGITWGEALDEIAYRMREAKDNFGPESVGIYSGSGNDGMASRYAARFANAFGCRMIPGIVEICFQGAYEGARFNVGPFPPHELQDWANSKCIVIWGTNKYESSLHSKRVIDEAIDNGAKLIVIDPRKTPYAKRADLYTTIRPGTDSALALGMANEIIRRNLYDHDFVENHVHGFEEFAARASEYDTKRVSEITWIEESMIRELATMFATHGPALIMTAPAGMNHYTNGTWAARAVHSLLAICGYLGVSGGGFQYLSSDNSSFNGAAVTLPELLDSSIMPVVPSGTYVPDYVLGHETSPFKVFVIQAASPITQWPNTNKVIEALNKIPFKVCIDIEMTDTARLCDIVLPATFIFEHDNLVHSELHRIVQYAPKLVEPRGEARSELDIWKGVAEILGIDEHFQLTEIDAIRLALQSEDCKDITLEKLIEKPEGIRTRSPAIPFSDRKFKTRTGRVHLYVSELEEEGLDPLPFHEEPLESPLSTPRIFEEYPLIMITGRLRERLHSQYTTVTVGGAVKSYAHCTTCKKCVEECPDEAIFMTQPSTSIIQKDVGVAPDQQAPLRKKLGQLVGELAVQVSTDRLHIPTDITGLLIPEWDASRCIGCRECEVEVCPYDVVTETIRMPTKGEAGKNRVFIRMHPRTANELGLRSGDRVNVESKRGTVSNVRLELTEDIDPRIVWSSDGWWDEDGNINYLTDDKHTAFGSTPGFNSVLVRVRPSRN
ncbi:MAG: molybdopterin-dependent oxidoreductase [Candidatus Thorarchaeota archaeon]